MLIFAATLILLALLYCVSLLRRIHRRLNDVAEYAEWSHKVLVGEIIMVRFNQCLLSTNQYVISAQLEPTNPVPDGFGLKIEVIETPPMKTV